MTKVGCGLMFVVDDGVSVIFRRGRVLRRVLFVWVMLGVVWLGGCASGPGKTTVAEGGMTPDRVSTNTLESASADYREGRYGSAYTTATLVYSRSRWKAVVREQSGYLAGMSAYQLKRYDDADRYLTGLTTSGNAVVAGNASATLGLVDREERRDAEAVVHFKEAYRKLSGQDRAEAAYQCGMAYRAIGQPTQARQQFLLARGASDDPSFRAMVGRYLEDTGWTIQIGAFSTLERARKRVAEYDRMSSREALGSARIIDEYDTVTRKSLYLVQVGNFLDYELASRARWRITGPSMVATLAATNSDSRGSDRGMAAVSSGGE